MNDNQLEKILFPHSLFSHENFPEEFQAVAGDLKTLSCFPTYPWAQFFYFNLIRKLNLPSKGVAVEFGVAKGGMSLFLGRMFKESGRKTLSFDTFTGAPFSSGNKEKPYYKQGDYQAGNEVSQLPQFREMITKLSLDGFVIPVPGDFASTEFKFPNEAPISFAHIDCNLYASTLSALNIVWDKVIEGGAIVLDEFFHSSMGVKTAAYEFFTKKGISPNYHLVFPYSVVIIKGEKPGLNHADIEGNFYDFDLFQENKEFLKALESNIKILERGPLPSLDNAKLLQNIISQPSTSHEIHLYLWLMRDFWNRFYHSPEAFQSRGIIKK